MTTKHTAIYCRVSTVGQDHASQLPDLERWLAGASSGTATDVGAGPAVVWYKDTFTGRTMDRPGMGRMLDAILCGKVERVVVWRLDRLGRTAKGLCALFDDLTERGVDLVSIKDGFSLNTPAGRLHARILASVAEYETEIRAERVRAGQAAAKARGRKWGGSKAGRLLKVTPEQVEAIRECAGAGGNLAKLSRTLGLSRQTIYRVVRNGAGGDSEG